MDLYQYSGQVNDPYNALVGISIDAGVGVDKITQWSAEETRDFLTIRGELDPNFVETKRNRFLWELVSARMAEIGYNRTAAQCKGKWKNLVTRYKGCETMETEEMRQEAFQFYNEMTVIYNARMQRLLWLEVQANGGGCSTSIATTSQNNPLQLVQVPSNQDYQNALQREKAKKKRKKKEATANTRPVGETSGNSSTILNGLKEIMAEYMNKQMEMEKQMMKAYEEREEKRRVREMEWRAKMEQLENERLMMMRLWGEREEQRKIREELRAERKDALITILLNKLRRN